MRRLLCTCEGLLIWTALALLLMPEVNGIACERPPTIVNGSYGGDHDDLYTFGIVVIYTCNKGFSLIGQSSLECIVAEDGLYGKWNRDPPQCKGNCLTSEIPSYVTFGGKELNDSYPIGTILRCRCIPGYTATALSIQCRNDSTWSETCQRKNCKVPVIENGEFKDFDNLRFRDEVSFTCKEGYILLGKNTSRCTLFDSNIVDWNPAPPHCERIACERPPTIVNGSYGGDHDDLYTFGIVVIYTCNKGFSLIGQSSLECIVAEDGLYGKWNRDPPQCKVVNCDRPRIVNGRLTSGFQASYKYDHVLQYICNAGYTVVESGSTRCIANSTWHPTPKCVKVPATTAVPVHPGENTTSGSTQRPGLTTSTTETGTTQRPSLTTSTTDTEPNSATIAVGKLSLIVVLLILTT